MADLTCELDSLKLKNPVMTASGTFGYGMEYHQYYDIAKLGAVVVKGIATFESHGNPTPRVAEVHSGMLNAIGLQGPGIDKFLHDPHYMPFLRTTNATVIVNIWGKTIEQYQEVAARLDADSQGIAALEINISCPNVKEGGVAFGTDLKLAGEVIRHIRAATKLPLITKLSPNVTKVADFARVAVDNGSDMISLINTITGMAIDIESRRPKIANLTGGLSGPAVNVPIIGMGGISCGADAIEFMLAGADAVAVGTATFQDPYAPLRVIGEINEYLDRHNIKQVKDIVGALVR